MSFVDNGNGLSAADVAAVTGGNRGGFGFGNGDGAWWIIILFLFAFAGNWGNNGNGGGNVVYPMMGGMAGDVQRGFDQSAVMSGIGSIQASLANAEVSRCNAQTNVLQALNGIGMSLQNCCCENRAGLADLKYAVATENCADRQAVSDGFKDLMTFNSGKFQMIMDKLCALELDGVKQRNQELTAENTALKFDRSQVSQNGYIADLANSIINRLNPAAVPAYIVQNPNCCNQVYNGCGCNQ